MSKSIQHKWYIKLHCIINDSKNSKNQQFDVETVPLDCNVIQKDTPVLVFLWVLAIFSVCNFIKNETTPQVNSCKFCEMFQLNFANFFSL